MATKLYIRSFSSATHRHKHDYHQLVVPLRGSAENYTDMGDGPIGPGQCMVQPAGLNHSFVPDPDSSFLVADMDELPTNLQALTYPIVSVPPQIFAFCQFVETQLQNQVSPELEASMGNLFMQLLEGQEFLPSIDKRIAKVIAHLRKDLTITPSIEELANIATLSISQLKALFKSQTSDSPHQYLTQLRMEKARALLAHTDVPINLVAHQVGYGNVSAFSRRFNEHFGHSPRASRSQ